MAVSYAQVWLWVKRIIRFYLVLVLILWLLSSCVLFYLLHSAHTSPYPPSSTSLDPSLSPPPPLTGPYRIHALLHSSVDHLHSRLSSLLSRTRATSTRVLDSLDRSLNPSTPHRSPGAPPPPSGGPVGGVRRGVEGVVGVMEEVVDLLCAALRHVIDEWLIAAIELTDDDGGQPLPWQQERLDAARGVQREPPAAAAAASSGPANAGKGSAGQASPPFLHVVGQGPPMAPVLKATPPLTSLVKRPLPDGSMLYLSPEPSSSPDFTAEMVAGDLAGKVGERRVMVSAKDGLLRVTWKGGGEPTLAAMPPPQAA